MLFFWQNKQITGIVLFKPDKMVSLKIFLLIYFYQLEPLKDKFCFLHIKPCNKDIYNHIKCSASLSWQTLQSGELALIADVMASWKQQRSMNTQTIHWKMQ